MIKLFTSILFSICFNLAWAQHTFPNLQICYKDSIDIDDDGKSDIRFVGEFGLDTFIWSAYSLNEDIKLSHVSDSGRLINDDIGWNDHTAIAESYSLSFDTTKIYYVGIQNVNNSGTSFGWIKTSFKTNDPTTHTWQCLYVSEMVIIRQELYAGEVPVILNISDRIDREIVIYPNPSTTHLNYNRDLTNCFYHIIDIKGQVVQENKIISDGPISVNGLKRGTYMVNFSCKPNSSYIFKFIKN